MNDVPVNNVMMFLAELTSSSPLAKWLAQQMAPLPVTDEWRFALDFAAYETAASIIRYVLYEDRESRFGVKSRAADRRVILHFTDAGKTFPVECLALARGDEHFDVGPLTEGGRGLRLILRMVDFFDAEMNVGKSVTALIKTLPDPPVNYSTDKNDG